MSEQALFDSYASDYDGYRRQLIPGFDRFYGTMLERIPFSTDQSFKVVDLGAGTGLSSRMIESEYPGATIELLDQSSRMLEKARGKFGSEDHEFRREDLREIDPDEGVWDLAFSALVLHYLRDTEKRRLISRVFKGLSDGGAFIVGTVVEPPDESLQDAYQAFWQRKARKSDAPESIIQDARERLSKHHRATIGEQLEWLRDAGFDRVDCWFKYYGLAVFSGRK